MGWFKGMDSAKVQKTGQYFKPGKYRVKILAVKQVEGQKGKNYTVIETQVLSSDNPEIPVGSEKSQVIEMSNVMALPNLKAFLGAASGVDATLDGANDAIEKVWYEATQEQLSTEDIFEKHIVESNLLEGTEMDLECQGITTQAGKPFTKYNWGIRHD